METTTGPLGQGVANSVGIALAGRWLARALQPAAGYELFDFDVYALAGDGCMMEGVCFGGGVARGSPATLPDSAGSTTPTA